MANKDEKYFYVGIKWKGNDKSDEEEEKRHSLIYALAEKYGKVSVSISGGAFTKGTDIEFGFPEVTRKGAFSFLEEALDSGHADYVAMAKGDKGF